MSPSRVLRVVAGVAALAFLLTPSAVLADCMMPAPVKEAAQTAEVVFIGTVTETTNRDSWASVAVEEIWRGPDLPATVVVKGGSGGDGISSVDRSFQAGVKYLFFPYADEQGDLADNSCTNTIEWSADLAQVRPASVRQPVGSNEEKGGFDVGGVIAPLGVALLVGGVLLGAGLLARGRAS
jgi:hypothetical protein